VTENEKIRTIGDLPEQAWQGLAEKKIFFGHQSVGFNLLAGVEAVMAEHPEIQLRLVESTDLTEFDRPVFAHARVGSNRDPGSKNVHFQSLLAEGIADRADLAALKYCYVDIHKESDVAAEFAAYQQSVEQIRQAHSELVVVHMTVPLREAPITFKTRLKLLLGKRDLWELNDNIARNLFNQMLRAEYADRDPVFDLARWESTRPDGSRESIEIKGKRTYALVPEYTEDGGHLNEVGRRFVAEQLLIFLAEL